ncbi:hypothetical protein PHOSAC3_120772 [Mesotoga infera]|nr:hypothetical protein PHOSAC3_120772 [Mesotoga infera]
MTEFGVFGVTIRCHPGLDPGSVPRTNNLDAQRRNEEPRTRSRPGALSE